MLSKQDLLNVELFFFLRILTYEMEVASALFVRWNRNLQ